MEKCKYEDVTIQQVENAMKTGYITGLIFDADSKTISLEAEEAEKIYKVIHNINESLKPVYEAIIEVGKTALNVAKTIASAILEVASQIPNKKISKKRFIKLLQSQGIQRNQINEVIKNNKQSYTYLRYINTANELLKKNKQ